MSRGERLDLESDACRGVSLLYSVSRSMIKLFFSELGDTSLSASLSKQRGTVEAYTYVLTVHQLHTSAGLTATCATSRARYVSSAARRLASRAAYARPVTKQLLTIYLLLTYVRALEPSVLQLDLNGHRKEQVTSVEYCCGGPRDTRARARATIR